MVVAGGVLCAGPTRVSVLPGARVVRAQCGVGGEREGRGWRRGLGGGGGHLCGGCFVGGRGSGGGRLAGVTCCWGSAGGGRWARGVHFGTGYFVGCTGRSDEHTSELQSRAYLVSRLWVRKKN